MKRPPLNIPFEALEQFLAIPGEQILLSKRTHFLAAIIPLGILGVFFLVSSVFASFVFLFLAANPMAFLLAFLFLAIATITTCIHIVVDWYFHIYLVTTRRIVEIRYKPFIAQDVNDVLLDQVRCTEVDVKSHGYIYSLVDVGDIIITFDRPTHQQEYVLQDMHAPRHIANMLGQLLNTPKAGINSQVVWFKKEGTATPYMFSEEIMSRKSMQLN